MSKRLQNIIRQYDGLYLDNIWFNENTFELEIDLFQQGEYNRSDFVDKCHEIRKKLEKRGYQCAYDEEYDDYTYRLYIII